MSSEHPRDVTLTMRPNTERPKAGSYVLVQEKSGKFVSAHIVPLTDRFSIEDFDKWWLNDVVAWADLEQVKQETGDEH